jgi:hypothetical protein
VAGEYVNLNDVGALTRSGQGYDSTAEDNAAESRTFAGRMEASQQGLRGAAGSTFTNVATMHGGNLTSLANHIADQAFRAVHSERVVVDADGQADSAQSATLAGTESQSQAVSRQITY